jgi:Leucine-rich repeat (LRR) protein
MAVLANPGAQSPVWREVTGGRIRALPTPAGHRTGFTRMPPDTTGVAMTNSVSEAAMANNRIEGTLPNFPNYVPSLRELDLSNQKGANWGGLSGAISVDVYKLVDLLALNLAGNSLTGEIPLSIGDLDNLKFLNLSSNKLTKEVPSNLGRLIGTCLTWIY